MSDDRVRIVEGDVSEPSEEAMALADSIMDQPPFELAWRSDELQIAIAKRLDRLASERAAEAVTLRCLITKNECGPALTERARALHRLLDKYQRHHWDGLIETAFKLDREAAAAEARRAAIEAMLPRLRCFVTKNICGTDTWAIGQPCRCPNCQLSLEIKPDTPFPRSRFARHTGGDAVSDFPWWQDGFVYMPIALLVGGIIVLICALVRMAAK